MLFGEVKTKDAEGAILAHSLRAGERTLKKGIVLGKDELNSLQSAGIKTVVVARLEAGDIHEDDAAKKLAKALDMKGVELREPFTGRVNLFANEDGVFCYDPNHLNLLNEVDEGITLALLPTKSRVAKGQILGTIKIIPYAVAGDKLDQACAHARDLTLETMAFLPRSISLVLTTTANMKPSLIQKGEQAVRARVMPLGANIDEVLTVSHSASEISRAIQEAKGDWVMVLTASATSDRRDVAPSAVVEAGGTITRYGIPIDPGNLLFLGELGEKTVIGLPGCVRSPVLNGTDFVLERLMAGLEISSHEFAAMGAGGFLKEMPSRPQPRLKNTPNAKTHHIAAVILASGASSRMRGSDKLLEEIDGTPLLEHVFEMAKGSQVDNSFVVLPENAAPERHRLISDHVIFNPAHMEGIGASIRAATQALYDDYEAIIFLLADMPEINRAHINKLIAAYSPQDGREICRATSASGEPGHPVLFGQRFFESLMQLRGDMGAKPVISRASQYVEYVRMDDDAPLIDLDTPEAWAKWRASRINLDQ